MQVGYKDCDELGISTYSSIGRLFSIKIKATYNILCYSFFIFKFGEWNKRLWIKKAINKATSN